MKTKTFYGIKAGKIVKRSVSVMAMQRPVDLPILPAAELAATTDHTVRCDPVKQLHPDDPTYPKVSV